MGIGAIIGPGGSYIPSGPGLPFVTTDIQTLQTNYDEKQQAVADAYGPYSTALATLSTDIAILQDLIDNGGTPTQINNAKSAVSSDHSAFNPLSTAYQATIGPFQIAASALVNAKAAEQQLVDSATSSTLNTAVINLSGAIDVAAHQRLSDAYTRLQTARTTMNSNFALLTANTIAVASARSQLSQLSDTAIKAYATAIVGSSPPTADWTTYNTAQANAVAQQAVVGGLVSTRGTLETSTNAATTAFNNALYNTDTGILPDTAGFMTLLVAASDEAHTSATAYIAQVAADRVAATDLTTTLRDQRVADDLAARTEHYVLYPTINTPLDIDIDLAAAAGSLLQTSIANAIPTVFSNVVISTPKIPAPGAGMSMSDLLRFFGNATLISNEVVKQAQRSDSAVGTLRAQLWELLISQVNAAYSARLAYLQEIQNQDSLYVQQVALENDTRYASASTQVGYLNTNLSTINTTIGQINSEIQTKNANGIQIVNQLNTAAPSAVNALNVAQNIEPNAVNLNDLFNEDPNIPLPIPLPVPALVGYPTTIPPFPALTGPPSVPTPPSDVLAIDTFNAAATIVNDTLYPIRDRFVPPFELIPLITYRENIPIRLVNESFDFAGVSQALENVYKLVASNTRDRGNKLFDLKDSADFIIKSDTSVSGSESAGSSVAFAGTNSEAPTKVTGILNLLMQSKTYTDALQALVEQATLTAALQAGLRIPTDFSDHSSLGIVHSEFVDQKKLQGEARDDILETSLELKEVADQLLLQATDIEQILQKIQAIIAGFPEAQGLTDEQLKDLISGLAFITSFTLLFLAATAIAAIGEPKSPAEIGIIINQLFQKTQTTEITPPTQTAEEPVVTTPRARPAEVPPPPIDIPRPLIQQALALSSVSPNVRPQLQTLVQASLSPLGTLNALPGGATQFNKIVQTLNDNGFEIPPSISPLTPAFLPTLLTQVQNRLTPDGNNIFKAQVNTSLTNLGLPQVTLDRFSSQVRSGTPIAKAVETALTQAPSDLIQELPISLNTLPPTLQSSLTAQTSSAIPSLPILTPQDKTVLTLAIASRKIDPKQASQVASSLNSIQTTGATPETIGALASILHRKPLPTISELDIADRRPGARLLTISEADITASRPIKGRPTISEEDIATRRPARRPQEVSPVDTRQPMTLPKDTLVRFKDALEKLTAENVNEKQVGVLAASFANLIVNQKDFYQFSIDFLLDPAKSFVKNFSIITAEPDKKGRMQTPNAIPV